MYFMSSPRITLKLYGLHLAPPNHLAPICSSPQYMFNLAEQANYCLKIPACPAQALKSINGSIAANS